MKWSCLLAQALFLTVAIALVHSRNPGAAAIAIAIFATGFATSILLIASHDHPFAGQFSIKPDVLLQVKPDGRPLVPTQNWGEVISVAQDGREVRAKDAG